MKQMYLSLNRRYKERGLEHLTYHCIYLQTIPSVHFLVSNGHHERRKKIVWEKRMCTGTIGFSVEWGVTNGYLCALKPAGLPTDGTSGHCFHSWVPLVPQRRNQYSSRHNTVKFGETKTRLHDGEILVTARAIGRIYNRIFNHMVLCGDAYDHADGISRFLASFAIIGASQCALGLLLYLLLPVLEGRCN